jgi:prevent-host-death family protein
METVSVAQLKARLSEYLRRVEAGERFLILNRRAAVGVLVPFDAEEDDLVIRQPEPGTPTLGELDFGPPLDLGFDVVDLLLEDRQDQR